MGPVSAEIEIDAPRERVFAAIADLARRPAFTDHFLHDFHLTRIESSGIGAGARFRTGTHRRSVWMDTSIVGVEAPHKLIERGSGGRANRIPATTAWELIEGTGLLTAVRVSFWTDSSNPIDRAVERFSGGSGAARRGWNEALRRLRDLLESDEDAPPRVAVAGGNPYATGIP